MRKFIFHGFMVFGLLCVLRGGESVAEERAKRAGGVCDEAADRYCWNVEPGHGRVWQCLKQNENNLNASCRKEVSAHLTQMETAMKSENFQKACKSDRKKYCRYVEWTDTRVTKCLRIHDVELTDKCRAALP